MINNIDLKLKAQIILNRETQEAASLMSRTKQGWPLFSLLFTIVLKFLSNVRGSEIDMNHNYKRERNKSIIFSP